jgi:NAD(P)-dependent dehydrogenase (short-subunit alcohol dehydrogenase family)
MTQKRTAGISGKVVLVTGASKGIGYAIAKAMSASGAKVMISSRKKEFLQTAAATLGPNVAWYAANAGDPQHIVECVEACVRRFGRVDILVNNAATNPYYGPLLFLDVSRAEKTVRVNQLAPILWMQAVWRSSMEQHGGVILNICSAGGLSVEPSIGWYNATKAALMQLTSQMAYELAPTVRVNGIAPGLVKTDMAKDLWMESEKELANEFPLKRLGEPADIAAAAAFLASDSASWITGQTLVVDGGALVRPPVRTGTR